MVFNLAKYAEKKKEEKDKSPETSDQDDFVEKVLDSEEDEKKDSKDEKPSDSDSDVPSEEIDEDGASLIGGGGLLKILTHLKDMMSSGLTATDPDVLEPISNPFEVLEDEDFDGEDETVQSFKNDMGGCKGMIRIIRIDDPKAEMKLSQVISALSIVREASRNKELRGIFGDIHAAMQGNTERQQFAAQKLARLASDALNEQERFALAKAEEAVIQGTPEYLDAAAFRVRGVFASRVPTKNLRVAYTTLRQPTEGEPVQNCPKALYQLGRAEVMPISVCRDQCIDSRVQRDGRVACAYSDWTRLADTHEKAMGRLETIRHPDNKGNLLSLEEGERSKPLTEAERSIEQRMAEDLKNREKPASDDAVEKQLEEDKVYGHQGEVDETIFSLNRTASKTQQIDPESEDTVGTQIENKSHTNDDDFGEKTIEEMLADEQVGLSESDLDKILEEWLDESRQALRSEAKQIEKKAFEGVKKG